MRQRLISAAVLVPVVVVVFAAGQPWLSIGLAIVAALAAYEAAVLVRAAGLRAYAWLALTAPLLSVLAFETLLRGDMVEGRAGVLLASVLALWLMIAALPALREPDPGVGFRGWIGTVFAGLYPSLLAFAAGVALLSSGQAIARPVLALDYGRLWLLLLVAAVWSYDSFAYLSGRYFGRGRFMYHISPAKTWSGVIGGTVAAAVASAALATALFGIEPWWGAALGVVLAVAAQTGDLAESMLKRAAGAKDSGKLIPGHGGFLDRVDSFLFAAPALYAVLILTDLARAGGSA
jgi:phosphatidate cytidylyltransferase